MITLRVVQTTPKLILEWDPVPGAVAGYRGRSEGTEKWTQTQQTRMTFAANATGIVIQALGVEDEGHHPPTTPPPLGFTYRFASYNTATDKITGCLSRFQPTYSWWIPGTPEVGTPWPDDGGIHPITHPIYGPGFRLVTVDGMTYPPAPNQDSINCRNAVDPASSVFGGDTRLRNPVPGSTHAWEGVFMRPSGFSWPANTQHESLWEMFAICNGFSNVYHHLFMSNNRHAPGFKYYFGRQVLMPTESPTKTYLWVRHVCPIEFAPDEYHKIRWQIKWSNPGVANGSFKAQTSLDGGPFQQWLDLNNIDTTTPSFQRCYGAAQVGLRAPLGSGPLSYHVHNLGVAIS